MLSGTVNDSRVSPPESVDAHAELAELYAADRREHAAVPSVGTPEYQALRDRDRVRRAQATEVLRTLRDGAGPSSLDLYHAAWLFNHGDDATEVWRAHVLAREAAERGHGPARWLAAAAYDRWCMFEGRAQKYGTQFVPDGKGYRLWDVEPETTDEERRQWDVPPLAEQLQRAEDLSRCQPQPPMHDAPDWLRAAIERWRSADG